MIYYNVEVGGIVVNIKFVVNDYVLVWNLLFQASINERIHKLKQKLQSVLKIFPYFPPSYIKLNILIIYILFNKFINFTPI